MTKSKKMAATISVKNDEKGNPLPLEKQFDKMCDIFSEKVDGDTRDFCLGTNGSNAKVFYIKTSTYMDEGDTKIPFVKDDPVLPENFKLTDYPPEVQKVLKKEMDRNYPYDESGHEFPNVIPTGEGATFEDAIQDMLDKMVLLDHGWNLFANDHEYYEDHSDFFPDDDDDDDDFLMDDEDDEEGDDEGEEDDE